MKNKQIIYMGKRLTIKERLERKFKKATKEILKYQKVLALTAEELSWLKENEDEFDSACSELGGIFMVSGDADSFVIEEDEDGSGWLTVVMDK